MPTSGAVDDHRHRGDLDVDQGAVLAGAPRRSRGSTRPRASAGRWRGPLRGVSGVATEVSPSAAERLGLRVAEEPLRPRIPPDHAARRGPSSRSPPGSSPRASPSTASDAGSPRKSRAFWMASTDWVAKVWRVATTSGANAPYARAEDHEAAEQPALPDQRHGEERAQPQRGSGASRACGATSCRSSWMSGTWTGFWSTAAVPIAPSPSWIGRRPEHLEILGSDLVRGPRRGRSRSPRRTRTRCRCRLPESWTARLTMVASTASRSRVELTAWLDLAERPQLAHRAGEVLRSARPAPGRGARSRWR